MKVLDMEEERERLTAEWVEGTMAWIRTQIEEYDYVVVLGIAGNEIQVMIPEDLSTNEAIGVFERAKLRVLSEEEEVDG